METFFYPDVTLPRGNRPVVTLGNFDGVHLGHQRIMKSLIERGRMLGTATVAVTFEPHPISVLRADVAPKRILTPSQKVEVLGDLGIDVLLIINFTAEFSQKEPRTFVREVLVEKLGAAELVLGVNFRFGRARSGDLEALRTLGEDYGFEVKEVEPAVANGRMISSSRIRSSLAAGNVAESALMLGRPYFVDGDVVKGDGRGRRIGFPTANLRTNGDLLVGDGVYATRTRVAGRVHQSMSHIGPRPTFGISGRSIETHVFDVSRDLLGESLRLWFYERLRGTEVFDGPEALKAQLEQDRDQARDYFRDHGNEAVL